MVAGDVRRLAPSVFRVRLLVSQGCFFFSSRRRHTRFDCDWSSNVCSSDLPAVPEHGSYHTIRHRHDAEVLVRDRDRVRLLSNVCLHRNLMMHTGRGKANAMICPMHRWSYDLSGHLRNAPFYPETPCLALPERPLTQWSGILFA